MSMVEFTGQTYGEGSRQRASQRMMRPGPSPTDVAAQRAAGSRRVTVPRRTTPPPPPQTDELGPFDRPTEFPDEPVTAGAPVGPGPNTPMVPIGIQPGSKEDLTLRLRAIASKYPNPALLQMLKVMERRNGMA